MAKQDSSRAARADDLVPVFDDYGLREVAVLVGGLRT